MIKLTYDFSEEVADGGVSVSVRMQSDSPASPDPLDDHVGRFGDAITQAMGQSLHGHADIGD